MTAGRRIQIASGTLVITNLAVVITVIGAMVWVGRKIEQADRILGAAVTVEDHALWAAQTQIITPGWKPADMLRIHNEHAGYRRILTNGGAGNE